MRVLDTNDLRWVSGGQCSMYHAETDDVYAAIVPWHDAQVWTLYCQNLLASRSTTDPDYQDVLDSYNAAVADEYAKFNELMEVNSSNFEHILIMDICKGDHQMIPYLG